MVSAGIKPERDDTMRIAIPVHGDKLNSHFGQSRTFRIFTATMQPPAIEGSMDLACPEGCGCGQLGAFLQANQVNVVLVGGIGAGALQHLNQAGLEVIAGVGSLPPEQLAAEFVAGKLVGSGATCQSHGHHGGMGHGHGHGHGNGHGHRHGQCQCRQPRQAAATGA